MMTRDPQDIIIHKRARAKAKKIIKNSQSTDWQNYCSSISSNIKLNQIWLTIKRFTKHPNSTHIPPLKQNGISSISNTDKANILVSHFQSTNSNEDYSSTF